MQIFKTIVEFKEKRQKKKNTKIITFITLSILSVLKQDFQLSWQLVIFLTRETFFILAAFGHETDRLFLFVILRRMALRLQLLHQNAKTR